MILNIDDVVFTTDRALDKILTNSKLVSREVYNLRRRSPWLYVCARFAPSSLVLRLYILQDLYRHFKTGSAKSRHEQEIMRLLDLLSFGGTLWAEGYSFWFSLLRYLFAWSRVFDCEQHIRDLIDGVDAGFCHTAYMRRGAFFPAPFGYLRDEPLSPDLQVRCIEKYDVMHYFGKGGDWIHAVEPVSLIKQSRRIFYKIYPRPVGLNSSTPWEFQKIQIMNGMPLGFRWFTSEFDKYKDPNTQRFSLRRKFKDIFNPKRIKCVIQQS